MRKPMTAKELVQKFGSKQKQKMTKEQMTQRIGQLLKKIGPERKYVNGVLYLSLKKDWMIIRIVRNRSTHVVWWGIGMVVFFAGALNIVGLVNIWYDMVT